MTPLDTRALLARVSTVANHPTVPYRLLRDVIALVDELNAERIAHDTLAGENALLRRSQACGCCGIAKMAARPSEANVAPMEVSL
jgi:hypothetical protein